MKKYKEYLLEALLIVFSVLLALFLNEHRENVKIEKALSKSLDNIKNELIINKQVIDSIIPYHGQVLTNIDSALHNETYLNELHSTFGPKFFMLAPKGLFQETLNSTAWQTTMLNPNVSNIDNRLLQLLTKTYAQQELTYAQMLDIINKIYSR